MQVVQQQAMGLVGPPMMGQTAIPQPNPMTGRITLNPKIMGDKEMPPCTNCADCPGDKMPTYCCMAGCVCCGELCIAHDVGREIDRRCKIEEQNPPVQSVADEMYNNVLYGSIALVLCYPFYGLGFFIHAYFLCQSRKVMAEFLGYKHPGFSDYICSLCCCYACSWSSQSQMLDEWSQKYGEEKKKAWMAYEMSKNTPLGQAQTMVGGAVGGMMGMMGMGHKSPQQQPMQQPMQMQQQPQQQVVYQQQPQPVMQ